MTKITLLFCLIAIKIGLGSGYELLVTATDKLAADGSRIVRHDGHDKGLNSPISAELVLSLATQGAEGETYEELKKVLYLPDKDETRSSARELTPILNRSNQNFNLSLAIKLYINEKYQLNESYERVAVDDFNSGIEKVNFADSSETTRLINEWVESKTNNKIQNMITSDQINAETALVLVNTLYLKGKWVTPFPLERTRKSVFFKGDNTTEIIDFMNSADDARYLYYHSENLKVKFLEIPFEDSNVSTTFILPDSRDGLENIQDNLELYLAPQDLELHRVAVSLPKITTTTRHDVKAVIILLGATKAFKPGEADLSDISDDKGLYINIVQQKTSLNITEIGTEAAAGTGVGISTSSIILPPPSRTFNADHPFYYFIRDNTTKALLFAAHLK